MRRDLEEAMCRDIHACGIFCSHCSPNSAAPWLIGAFQGSTRRTCSVSCARLRKMRPIWHVRDQPKPSGSGAQQTYCMHTASPVQESAVCQPDLHRFRRICKLQGALGKRVGWLWLSCISASIGLLC